MSETTKTSTAGRRHVSTACRPCRDDKIRCGGETPSCGQCTSKQRECTYSGLDRRKVSNRKTVQVFSRRVRQLERFIASQNLDVPAPVEGDVETLAQLSALFAPDEDSAPTPRDSFNQQFISLASGVPWSSTAPSLPDPTIPPPPLASPSASQLDSISLVDLGAPENALAHDHPNVPLDQMAVENAADADWVWAMAMMPQSETVLDSAPEMFETSLLGGDASTPMMRRRNPLDFTSPPVSRDDDSADDDDDDDHSAVSYQLSDRLGTLLLTGQGESHYYGSTSNYNLVQDEAVQSGRQNPYPSFEQVQECLIINNLDQHVEPEVINHLLSLYFTWHDPSLHVVDGEIFSRDRLRYESGDVDTAFFSPMLINAMCAVGADFDSKRDRSYPAPVAELFASRAVALLGRELERPRLATIQALSILSSHEIAYGRDTRAWVFSGMSVRLSVDFGLHVRTQPYVNAGTMSMDEARGRSVVFWGSFATDRMWGLYLGRPLHDFSKAVSVEKPTFFCKGQDESYWQSYGSPGSAAAPHRLQDRRESLIDHSIELYEIMSTLESSLYFQIDASNAELQRLAHETFGRLLAWKSNLPSDLNLDLEGPMPPACLPHLLILHMIYAYLVIALHRPFVAKNYIQPFPLVGPGPTHARDMCVRAALQIAKLVDWYEKQHTLSRANILVVQIVFSAALILVYATVSQSNPVHYQDLFTNLEVCSHALVKLGDMFENASRALEVLLRVKRVWQARLLSAPTGSKRPRPSFSERFSVKRRNEVQ